MYINLYIDFYSAEHNRILRIYKIRKILHIPFWFTAIGATLFVISEHRLWELLPEKAVKLTAVLMIMFAFANVTVSLLGF